MMKESELRHLFKKDMFAERPLGFVFDIDGTLSPLVSIPSEARLAPGVADLLESLQAHAHVAVLTGREIEDGASMINLDGLTYIGTHGLEWSHGLPRPQTIRILPEVEQYIQPARELLMYAEKRLHGEDGILMEYKRIGGAIHYRLAPNPVAARQKILEILEAPAADRFRLTDDKYTIEVRMPLEMDKGRALRQLVTHWNLQGILFAGDSRTDLDALLELAQLRREGKTTLGVVVQQMDTAPELLKQADVVVKKVEGMVIFLQECVQILQQLWNTEVGHSG